MKKILLAVTCLFFTTFSVAADLSGTYLCDLQDKSDGYFKSKIVLKLNSGASKLNQGYAAYDVDFTVTGIPYPYTGIAAARGNDVAIYFEATGPKKNPDDRGVGIASVVMDQDKSGKTIISLHKFYYEKSYKGQSDYGFENCVKTN